MEVLRQVGGATFVRLPVTQPELSGGLVAPIVSCSVGALPGPEERTCMFAPAVTDFWTPARPGQPDLETGHLRVVVDATLPTNRSVSVLELAGGGGAVTVTPARADRLGLVDGSGCFAGDVLDALQRDGVVMNDPDLVFYLPLATQPELAREATPADLRRLDEADASAFGDFARSSPADDLDEAFVELDHWLVFGFFDHARLVCAASMFPWRGTRLADLGVLTLPDHRGRGLARQTVRALCGSALAAGYEPQYRCQLDNTASAALAAAAGFTRYGLWHVVTA